MAWCCLLRLPSSFLPDEDQGVFLTMAQLPAGATQERTQKVLDEVTDYYLTRTRKRTLNRVFAVNGFGFAGRGTKHRYRVRLSERRGNERPW